MVKVTGSYERVTLGVSQQVPQDRRSGQYQEQINMVSDPVRGLARRHGSVMQDEVPITPYNASLYAAMIADTLHHRVHTFYVDGVEYDFIARTTTAPENATRTSFAWVFNKDTRKFLPIVYAPGDAGLTALEAGGVSSTANVGKFLYMAGNDIRPTWTSNNVYGAAANQQLMVAWVRGGAYSRTFKIILSRADGTKVTASYKTNSSSYPELLDTSDILTTDVDYQKKVNDRTNLYNSNVTKWIGTSAEGITPAFIAGKLRDSLAAQGVVGLSLTDSTVSWNDPAFTEVTCEDGGDGSLIRGVGNELTAADLVSLIHFPGKVVKVRPRKSNGDDAFYLRATARVPGNSGLTEVAWREAAGTITTPISVFCMALVKNQTFYIASTSTGLASISGEVIPGFQPNGVGDDVSAPLPNFYGKRISYLGVFQDRLVVGSGAVLNVSRPGDYLNFYRQSILTELDNDPWEGFALGSEDDTIRFGTTYDRNLLLYGERYQYIISGRQAFIPRTASIVTVSRYEDAVDAPPKSVGNYVFYGKFNGEPGQEVASIHQVQPGVIQDNPESYEVTGALDQYIVGKPVEIAALTAPNFVLLRTDGDRQKVYTYTYLDTANATERVFDSWSSWTWDPVVGSIVGLSDRLGGILVYVLRHGLDAQGVHQTWIACERFVRESRLSRLPYLDSLRAFNTPTVPTFLSPGSAHQDRAAVAFNDEGQFRFVGTPYSQRATFQAQYPSASGTTASVGFQYPASATLTNPYLRDRNGQAILTGRTTVGIFSFRLQDSGGCLVDVQSNTGNATVLDFSGRVLAAPTAILGTQPIVSTTIRAAVGKEVQEFACTLRAKTWLPLTLTSIEWVGQSFNRIRRV